MGRSRMFSGAPLLFFYLIPFSRNSEQTCTTFVEYSKFLHKYLSNVCYCFGFLLFLRQTLIVFTHGRIS